MEKIYIKIDGKQLYLSIYQFETMKNHQTLYVDIEDEKGVCVQPIVAIEQEYNFFKMESYNDKTPHEDAISVKVWGDPQNEDFTTEHIINIKENPWEEE